MEEEAFFVFWIEMFCKQSVSNGTSVFVIDNFIWISFNESKSDLL